MTTPDGSVVHPTYNEANFLETRERQPERRGHGHSVRHQYRLQRQGPAGAHRVRQHTPDLPIPTIRKPSAWCSLTTTRPGFPANQQTVQDLSYTMIPRGTSLTFRTTPTFRMLSSSAISASSPATTTPTTPSTGLLSHGREQLGLGGGGKRLSPTASSYNDVPRVWLTPAQGDGNAMGTYTEQYHYDAVGNFQQFIHQRHPAGESGMDAVLYLQRRQPAGAGKIRQSPDQLGRERQPAAERTLHLRPARQHDQHAAIAGHAMGLQRRSCT